MAKPVRFSLVGEKRLLRKLGKLDRRAQGKALRSSMRTAMEPVKELAQRRVPVDRGLLQKSIRVAAFSRRGVVGAQVRTGTRRQLRIEPGDRYYYPAALEYGTKYIKPRSFLRSSLYDRRRQVFGIVRRELRSAIRNATR